MYGFKSKQDAETLKAMARKRQESVSAPEGLPGFTLIYLVSPKTIITPAQGTRENMILGHGEVYIYHRDHYPKNSREVLQHKTQRKGVKIVKTLYNHTHCWYYPGEMLLALEDPWGDLYPVNSCCGYYPPPPPSSSSSSSSSSSDSPSSSFSGSGGSGGGAGSSESGSQECVYVLQQVSIHIHQLADETIYRPAIEADVSGWVPNDNYYVGQGLFQTGSGIWPYSCSCPASWGPQTDGINTATITGFGQKKCFDESHYYESGHDDDMRYYIPNWSKITNEGYAWLGDGN